MSRPAAGQRWNTWIGVCRVRRRRARHSQLLLEARRRRFDVLVCWRLDRFGRSLRHLIVTIELQALGIAFVSLGEGIQRRVTVDVRRLYGRPSSGR